MKLVREICEIGHARRKETLVKVRQPLSKLEVTSKKLSYNNLDGDYCNLISSELNIKEIHWESKGNDAQTQVRLDTTITPKLKAEGDARDLVRQIQDLRKKAGCRLDEKIVVLAPSWPLDFEDYIKKETLAESITVGDALSIDKKNA
jgi:hypothetical protein